MRVGWLGCGLLCGVAAGQVVVAVPRVPARADQVRDARFHSGKAVTGLPTERGVGSCSSDGLSFFPGAGMDVYSLTGNGEVRHFERKAPGDFGRLVGLDFYPGDEGLVSLVEGDKLDERDADGKPREVEYFLSTSDHEGDLADLVRLSVRYRPVKAAMFTREEYLLLGWDTGNRLPVLAVLRGDGEVKRFIDLGGAGPRGTTRAEVEKAEAADLKAAEGAKFVPFGKQVILTYPGTTRAMRFLSSVGQDRTLLLQMPAGYVLKDVLTTTGGRMTLVARVLEVKQTDDKVPARVRLFEFDAIRGERIREFTFGEAGSKGADGVVCAAGGLLTGLFMDEEKGLEVGTVRR